MNFGEIIKEFVNNVKSELNPLVIIGDSKKQRVFVWLRQISDEASEFRMIEDFQAAMESDSNFRAVVLAAALQVLHEDDELRSDFEACLKQKNV